MQPETWKKLESMFFAALDLPPENRGPYLDRACAGDPEFRAEIEAVLAAHALEEQRRERRAGLEPGVRVAPGRGSLVGTRIGAYQLEALIGRGGMGEVYRAQRVDAQYRQQVAVKVIRAGYADDELTRRFRVEREVLARLQHPNIATLLDGGVIEDGRPYLVMQHVDGVSITEYADAHRLSMRERLELLRTVCDAVQFAHANLIVHRDLKPTNILVTQSGQVRLLDFGIAKLLDPDRLGVTAPATEDLFLLTPEHAAPEQILGNRITTATDVYALGVLLYELLVGVRPFHATSRGELRRAVCELQPTRPSVALLSGVTGAPPGERPDPGAIANLRNTRADLLARQLRGDLDQVVLMALRKEPERRYTSAGQLGEDLARALAGRPVIAQPDTFGYRAKTFARRNRMGVAAAAGVFALVLGFGVVMAVQASRIAEERDRAQSEAEKATQVAGFLKDLFKAPDPYAERPDRRDTLRVADFLARGAEKVQSELTTQPAVEAELLNVLGGVFQNLGDLDAAQSHLQQGLEIRKELYGGEHLEVAESQQELGMLLKAKGQYSDAEALLREALATRRRLLGNEHADVAASLNALGSVLHDQGELSPAESLYQEGLAMRRKLLGPDHLDVASSLNNLATLLYHRGDYAAAEPLLRESLAIRRKLLGPEHPEVVETMSNLATVLLQRGDEDAAEPLYRDALQSFRETLGSEHPRVAGALNNLAALLKAKGDYDAAEPLYREALALLRTLHGEHPDVALALNNLASLLAAKGDYEAAELFYRESLDMRRRLLGESHPSVAASLNNLGVLMKQKGDKAAAVPLLRQAIAVNIESLGPRHPRVAVTMTTLGDLLYDSGRYDQAEPLFTEALAIYRAQRAADDPSVVELYRRLYQLYRDWDKPEQAAQFEPLIPK